MSRDRCRYRKYRSVSIHHGLLYLIALLLVLPLPGCSRRAGDPTGSLVERRTTDGTITTVRAISGSVWGGRAHLAEEVRIGADEGPEGDILSNVRAITCDRHSIYVLDGGNRCLRVYDMDGRHVRNIGRQGHGPGEMDNPVSLAIHPHNGTLFVRDGRLRRMNIYTPGGEVIDHWQLPTTWQCSRPSWFDTDAVLFTPEIVRPPQTDMDFHQGVCFGYISIGPEGALGDTLARPETDFRHALVVCHYEDGGSSAQGVPFTPRVVWSCRNDRSMVWGIPEDYRFEIRSPDGRTVICERPEVRVPVLPEEAEWHRRKVTASMRRNQPGWAWNGPEIPRYKPAYSDLIPDRSDRIWVVRQGPGVYHPEGVANPLTSDGYWQNPLYTDSTLIDVFDGQGHFLGEVEASTEIRFWGNSTWIEDDTVIACAEAPSGAIEVVRYRLVLPDGTAP